MPCLHGLWSGEQMLSPKVNAEKWKLTITLPGKTHPLIPERLIPGRLIPPPPGAAASAGAQEEQGREDALVPPVSPTPLVPRCCSSLCLLPIPACGDRARDTRPQGCSQLQTLLSTPGSTLQEAPNAALRASCSPQTSPRATAEQQRCLSEDLPAVPRRCPSRSIIPEGQNSEG